MTQPTEDEIGRYLDLTFQNIRRGVEQLEEEALWTVGAGSPMSGDDKQTDPYHVSHSARSLIGSAVDHLHAVSNLVETAQALHPMASFTLARGAIETAATVLWMLSPASRTERVTRRLRLALTDAEDGFTTSEELGVPRNRTRVEQRERLLEIGRAAGIADAAMRQHAKSTAIVKAADAVPSTPPHVLAAWRICSGFAHGRTWAILGLLVREEMSRDDEARVATYRLTNDTARMAWALGIALDTTTCAADLYRLRAAAR